jgi:hypothetical protein
VEQLYSVFKRYPLSVPVEGCPHCTSQHDEQRLASKPLRLLAAEALERFAFKAMTTWGSVDDFKHSLPRLFELVTDSVGVGDTNVEALLGKLPYAHWHRWPARERAAVHDFLNISLPYWSDRDAATTALDTFLRDPSTGDVLESAFFESAGELWAPELSLAVTQLEAIDSMPHDRARSRA